MIRKHRVSLGMAIGIVVSILSPYSAMLAQSSEGLERISVASDGTQANNGTYRVVISANGRYVAFFSEANNLVPGDTNDVYDLFIHDLQTAETTRASVASDGTQAHYAGEEYQHNAYGGAFSLSADGRFIAFGSAADNLVSGDTNGYGDVFVHDLQTGETTRVSVASDGTQGNDRSVGGIISADGRYVVFTSMASNLVASDSTSGVWDVFVHDRQTGETTLVSVASDGTQGNNHSSGSSISENGRYVLFSSLASNLVANDTNGATSVSGSDAFVHDRQTGETTRVSVASDGTQGDYGFNSSGEGISADGRYVVFSSDASNLVANDTNGLGVGDTFVHDRQTGETKLVSVASDGTQANGAAALGGISADGEHVVFYSSASNLVADDTNISNDVFVHDLKTGETRLVSVTPNGMQGNSESIISDGYSISADGRIVVFLSPSSDLVSDDTNAFGDAFVRDLAVSEQATPPVTLEGLEAVQTVQDWANSVRMVEGKRTFVRAFMEPVDPGTASVDVRPVLEGIRGGTPLPGSPLAALNPGRHSLANHNIAADRASLAKGAYFELPASWLTGTLTLNLKRADGGELLCNDAATPTPNDCSLTIVFEHVPTPEVKFISVSWSHNGITYEPTSSDIQELKAGLISIYPITDVNVQTGNMSLSSFVSNLASVDTRLFRAYINDRLLLERFFDLCWDRCERMYYGALKGPDVGGMANHVPGTVANGTMPDSNLVFAYNRQAHELGHLLGRYHAGPCENPAGSVGFPYTAVINGQPVATIGPIDQGANKLIYGLDTHLNRIIDPNDHYELMSYCGSSQDNWRWISDFTYEAVMDEIEAKFPSAPASAGVASPTTAQSYLVVSGLIDLANHTATFDPFGNLTSDVVPPPIPTGEYSLRLMDQSGGTVQDISFEPTVFELDNPGESPNLGQFIIPVPVNSAIKQVAVIFSGNSIGSRVASTHAPTITVINPNGGETLSGVNTTIRWSASDQDAGDTLSYMVQYSSDNGVTWETLGVDISGTSLTAPLSNLKGTTSGLFRVQASDGFNTATDETDGTFIIGNNAPRVSIDAPSTGSLFSSDQMINFHGHADDVEDGILSDSSLLWSSNNDGQLGTGRDLSIKASALSEGTHLITLTGTDSDAVSDTKNITITVTRLDVPSTPSSAGPLLTKPKDAFIATKKVTLGWKALKKAPQYEVQIDTDVNFNTPILIDQLVPKKASSKLPMLNFGRYYWHVRTQQLNGVWTGWSATRSLIFTALKAPKNGLRSRSNKPSFSWMKIPGASSYHLQIARDAGFTDIVLDVPNLSKPSYKFLKTALPLPSGLLYWRIQGVGSQLNNWTLPWSFTVP